LTHLTAAAIALSATFLTASKAQAADPKPPARPHILVILADDLGWKDVGYHGSEIRTPVLDRLAAAGVRLEQFYVQPVCTPTRASLMTGRYPIRYGLQVGVIRPWSEYGRSLEERMLPQALKAAGYRTAITGKWHLGCYEKPYRPLQRGFDWQYGMYGGAIDYFTHERDGGLDWHRNEKALREEGYSTNLIAREAVRIIEEHDVKQPLFLYLAFNSPHAPLQAPPEYLERYASITDRNRRTYAAMPTCMDDAIGRVLEALEKRGMRENTLILFSSDNGGPLPLGANNGPLRAGKGTVYEGGVRVPAFAVWPGRIRPGTVVNEMLHIVDWHPTLLKLAGASLEAPLPLDGRDAWPTMAEGKPSPRTEILHNVTPDNGAIRCGDWKLVVNAPRAARGAEDSPSPSIELFNIARDPYEKTNLANENPEKVKELHSRLDAYAKAAVPPKGRGGSMPRDFKVPKVWGEEE